MRGRSERLVNAASPREERERTRTQDVPFVSATNFLHAEFSRSTTPLNRRRREKLPHPQLFQFAMASVTLLHGEEAARLAPIVVWPHGPSYFLAHLMDIFRRTRTDSLNPQDASLFRLQKFTHRIGILDRNLEIRRYAHPQFRNK